VIDREGWPARELSLRELQHYLLGDPRIRADTGFLGRLDQKLDRLLRLARAILLAAIVALLTLVADLVVTFPHH